MRLETKICLTIAIFSMINVLSVKPSGFDSDISFITKVTKETAKISGQSFFHVVNLHRNFSVVPLLKRLHKNLIPTILINHSSDIAKYASDRRIKNMLFILNNCHDILNLILYSLSRERRMKSTNLITGEEKNLALLSHDGNDKPEQSSNNVLSLPNYCIRYGLNSLDPFGASFGGPRRKNTSCEAEMHVKDGDLESNSMLTDDVFNLTRGLHSHEIWNCENYLIFAFIRPNETIEPQAIKALDNSTTAESEFANLEICENPGCDLRFVFRFIWRFFHGYKAVICFKNQCYRYDPFYEKISEFVDSSESYFDFSWKEMNGKPLSFLYHQNHAQFDYALGWKFWDEIMFQAINIMKEKLDFTPAFHEPPAIVENEPIDPYDIETVLKSGIDFFVFEGGLRDSDSSTYDVSHPVDTGVLCFIAPRKGFMPQSIVVFKSSILCVWMCLLVIYMLVLIIHYIYMKSQLRAYQCIKAVNDSEGLSNLSTSAAIYSLLWCFSRKIPFLGKIFSAKILLMTFAMSTFVLVTVFQTEMVTLINKKVRYADINTIKRLQNISDHFVQATHLELDQEFPAEDLGYSWISEILTEIFNFSYNKIRFIAESDVYLSSPGLWKNVTQNETLSDSVRFESGLAKNTELRSDVFIFNIPYQYQRFMNIILFHLDNAYKFHYVQECTISRPYTFPIAKYSFYTDKVNAFLMRLNEAGIIQHMFRKKFFMRRNVLNLTEKDEPDEILRSFSIADLQIAFICLISGVVLSSFGFIVEKMYQFYFIKN